MSNCMSCKHCIMDYADGYGGYYFPDECNKDADMDAENCDEYEEDREDKA